MESNPAVWMLVVSYSGNVAMICLSDDRDEIAHYAGIVPTSGMDGPWDVQLMGHEDGVSTALRERLRQMARDGVPFVGRHAHLLGIATDFGGELQ